MVVGLVERALKYLGGFDEAVGGQPDHSEQRQRLGAQRAGWKPLDSRLEKSPRLPGVATVEVVVRRTDPALRGVAAESARHVDQFGSSGGRATEAGHVG